MAKLNIKEIKAIFTEIVRGYTLLPTSKYGVLYVKHVNSFDSADMDSERAGYERKAREMGVQSQEEFAKILKEQGSWTEENEAEIAQNERLLKNLHKTKSKLLKTKGVQYISSSSF